MNAPVFLVSMRTRGVLFFAVGGCLHWQAPFPLPPDDMAQARALKADLLTLVEDLELEARCAGTDPEEAAYLRKERAGVLEYEAGFSREEAELRAGMPFRLEKSA